MQSAGGAQQKLFLLKNHNRMESHPLGMGRVVGNVSWMEVGKEKLDNGRCYSSLGWAGVGGRVEWGGAGRKSEAAGSCLSWF